MELNLLKPRKSLNNAFRKVKPERRQIEQFKQNLLQLLDSRNDAESEEHHKNLVIDFLKKTYYDPDHFVNTKGRTDLVIHNGDKGSSPVGVIVETKKPGNKHEMIRDGKVNAKAFQELLLYYLRERITQKNLDIKYLIVTNINEWFIFDAHLFEKLFAQNKKLVKQFEDFESHRLAGDNTGFFYGDVAAPAIDAIDQKVDCTYFDFGDYEKALRNDNPKDDNKLIALYKLLSPQHLLKLPFANDSNSLDRRFYTELLHIIGLTETKQGSKKIIERNGEGQRHAGSLLENTISKLDSLDKVNRLERPTRFGATNQERLFNVGLELCITWINRILFLKLMEAQLVNYHKGDKSYEFLSSEKIHDYDDLEYLFFSVLARPYEQRGEEALRKFEKVPYLNSSLFESTQIEDQTILISNLRDEKKIPIHSSTVLKDQNGKKRSGELETLEYLFAFLNAYDFSSEGGEEIQEENKTLINASVLGLIFEKINGYKDGSFFTPGFITMYMSRETIRRAVVQKFNETKGWACENIDDVYDRIEDRDEANRIINSLKICDPAVGSGHFLVSALNEIIAIKHDLRILQDRDGRRLKEYAMEVANDELVITDDDGELFEYRPGNKESQRVQETLFHEKQTIIENCLFGVDINPNSVKICRLRLWIELLKNAYYVQIPTSPIGEGRKGAIPSPLGGGQVGAISPGGGREGALETLPNIDINIKEGNSLISRFDIDADLKKALRKSDGKWTIEGYRAAVATYRNAESKEQKREMEDIIEDIKSNFRSEISLNDPKIRKLQRLQNELNTLTNQGQLFEMDKREKAAWNKKVKKLTADTKKLETEIEEIRNNKIYENAFEWRFEFPEVLDDDGNFVGFDVVIGNPPYIRQEELGDSKKYLASRYETFAGTADIYVYFVELGLGILKAGGDFVYILPNKWMRAGYGDKMRVYLQNQNIQNIVDFGDLPVFEEATTYPCIMQIQKAQGSSYFKSALVKTLDFESSLANHLDEITFEVDRSLLQPKGWTLNDAKIQKLLQKLRGVGVPLGEYVDGRIYRGALTGLNEAFVIDSETRAKLIEEDPGSEEIIKPFLAGRDIKRYKKPESDKYLIFTRRGIDIDKYPAVLNYLEYFKERLMPKPKDFKGGKWNGRKPGHYKWYEIQDAVDYFMEFEKEKIIIPAIVKSASYSFDSCGFLGNDKTTIIPVNSYYLLGLLNSKLLDFFLKQIASTKQNGYFEYKPVYISQIPIIMKNNSDKEKKIESLVEEILGNSEPKQVEAEAEIDRLVYELYGLTDEEIQIVEESVG